MKRMVKCQAVLFGAFEVLGLCALGLAAISSGWFFWSMLAIAGVSSLLGFAVACID